MSEKKDKHLYSYKQALSQPYWIQKVNDRFSLKSPIKFSRLVYFVVLYGICWFVLAKLLGFTAFGFRGMLSVVFSWYFSMLLSDLVIDGKPLVFYLRDYLLFYFKYGIRADRVVINKGQVYDKVSIIKYQKGDK